MTDCIFCGRRVHDGNRLCREHQRMVDKENAQAKAKANGNHKRKAFKYVHYKGHLVGFFPGSGPEKYRPEYLGMSLSGIPKSRLYDLDHYVTGLDRQQVKRMKACVKALAHLI